MPLNDLVGKVTNEYERKARLYPALLSLFPMIATLMLLYGPRVSALTNVVTIALSCGGLYLVTNLCRELGKRLEPKLFQEWGGSPTTQLLRHRDRTIEAVTKRRYHSFLAEKINEPFPNPQQEANNPARADDVYQSGVRWLLNRTRDTNKFGLLFRENVAYGFRRNGLGIKPLGLAFSIGCLLWVLGTEGVLTMSSRQFVSKVALLALPETAIASLVASAAMLAVWIVFFTKRSVRTAAFTYAEMLLRACDTL